MEDMIAMFLILLAIIIGILVYTLSIEIDKRKRIDKEFRRITNEYRKYRVDATVLQYKLEAQVKQLEVQLHKVIYRRDYVEHLCACRDDIVKRLREIEAEIGSYDNKQL